MSGVGDLPPNAEMQSIYSTVLANWTEGLGKYILTNLDLDTPAVLTISYFFHSEKNTFQSIPDILSKSSSQYSQGSFWISFESVLATFLVLSSIGKLP